MTIQKTIFKNRISDRTQARSAPRRAGLMTRIRILLETSRLGDLMLKSGLLTQDQLQYALVRQKTSGQQLGRVLIEERMASRRAVYRSLGQQWTMRCLAAALGLFMTFSSFGGVKNARAGTVKDIPAQIQMVSARRDFTPVAVQPALFNSTERYSSNIAPFEKWTSMFTRFNEAITSPEGRRVMNEWSRDLRAYKNLPLRQMAARINTMVNKTEYIADSKNWGKGDYWATPIEFFAYGGDCEDFAITKYTALRALGVPEERLRIAIVHDNEKNIPHAVLVVYDDDGALILDNQSSRVQRSEKISHYRPIFSINREGWWLHKEGDPTVLASAAR